MSKEERLRKPINESMTFGEWYCFIHRVTEESEPEVKLAAYLDISKVDRDVPEYIKPYRNEK